MIVNFGDVIDLYFLRSNFVINKMVVNFYMFGSCIENVINTKVSSTQIITPQFWRI